MQGYGVQKGGHSKCDVQDVWDFITCSSGGGSGIAGSSSSCGSQTLRVNQDMTTTRCLATRPEQHGGMWPPAAWTTSLQHDFTGGSEVRFASSRCRGAADMRALRCPRSDGDTRQSLQPDSDLRGCCGSGSVSSGGGGSIARGSGGSRILLCATK